MKQNEVRPPIGNVDTALAVRRREVSLNPMNGFKSLEFENVLSPVDLVNQEMLKLRPRHAVNIFKPSRNVPAPAREVIVERAAMLGCAAPPLDYLARATHTSHRGRAVETPSIADLSL